MWLLLYKESFQNKEQIWDLIQFKYINILIKYKRYVFLRSKLRVP